MGDWGPGIYDNDDAMDWVYDLLDSGGLSRVKQALDVIAQDNLTLPDIADCRIALVAADLIAALDGDSNPDLPEEAEEWISLVNRSALSLRPKAEEAARKVLESSELRTFMEKNGKYELWRKDIQALLKRLEV
jgi:hypothetical protein